MLRSQRSSWLTNESAHAQRGWYIVDLEGKTLGRAATVIASVLRGKNKPSYTPNVDCGDFVVVINAEKIRLTGNKMANKMYRHHTGFIGGLKETTAEKLLQKHPDQLIKDAVWGMLPKGRLGRKQMKKLKVYVGPSHDHAAQQPKALEV